MIASNVVHDNAEGPTIPGNHTDGNGIIIDTTLGSYVCPTCGTAYPGNILVVGNVTYNNGGGGIHVFLSKNVVVANNTSYNNYLDPRNNGTLRGELSNGGSQNVSFINNIAYAVRGSDVTSYNKPVVSFTVGSFPTTGSWTANLTYGASNSTSNSAFINPSSNLVNVAPQLLNPVADNFIPAAGSPVLNAGVPLGYISTTNPNIGAY